MSHTGRPSVLLQKVTSELWQKAVPCVVPTAFWELGVGDPPSHLLEALPRIPRDQQVLGSGVLVPAQVGTGASNFLSVPMVTKPLDTCTPAQVLVLLPSKKLGALKGKESRLGHQWVV